MVEKYGIFLVNGPDGNYHPYGATGLTKLRVGDFGSLDEAETWLNEHDRITPEHFVMQYWVRG